MNVLHRKRNQVRAGTPVQGFEGKLLGGTMIDPKLKTRTRFSGSDLKGGKARVLIVEKATIDGGLVARFEIGMTEDEIKALRNLCDSLLNN